MDIYELIEELDGIIYEGESPTVKIESSAFLKK